MYSSTLTRAVLADPAEVVAAEVDQHHVLGALLGVVEQRLRLGAVLLLVGAARVGAGDRPRLGAAAAHLDQRLGRGAGDLEVAELEEVHVRRRVDGAQAAVDRERLDRRRRREALRRHDLEGVAGVRVLDDPRRRWPRSARGSRSTQPDAPRARRPAPSARGAGRGRGAGPGRAARSRASSITRERVVVGGVDRLALGERVGEHGDLVALGGRRRASARRPSAPGRAARAGSGFGSAERLDRAHQVVAEEADRAARERRQLLGLGDREPAEDLGGRGVGVGDGGS